MGLLYQMPVSVNEGDRSFVKNDELTLKSYGLPYIFWGYLVAILSVIFLMFIAIKGPMFKLMGSEDLINKYLAYAVLITIIGIPITLLCFFFYEKRIIKKGKNLRIEHRFFFGRISFKRKISLSDIDSFELLHHMDSPNIAKIKGNPEMKAFENRGYHQLFARDINNRPILLDRSSRPRDLKLIIENLKKY